MTQSPTVTEVQAAYDVIRKRPDTFYSPKNPHMITLLAAVKRDTLDWREVEEDTWTHHEGVSRMEYCTATDTYRHFVKDAAP